MAKPSTKSPKQNSPETKPSPLKLRHIIGNHLHSTFFLRPPQIVGKDLIGKILVVEHESGPIAVEIVETEGYSCDDPASHSYRGQTPRNASMFEIGGTAYVYLSYGINYCLNVATEGKGVGSAVLVRAGRPLFGFEMIKENRRLQELGFMATNGPGKLSQALGIDLDWDGIRFGSSRLGIFEPKDKHLSRVATTPRIGITKAIDTPWRFILQGSPWITPCKWNPK